VIRTLAVAVFCILLLVAGQTLLKVGLVKIGGTSFLGGDALLENVLKLFSTPYIFLGFVLYGISGILWLDVLSKLDFSVAFPLVSLTYIFALFIGAFIFHEQINHIRVGGVVLILGGLFLIIRSTG
jgi:drug/metabolite transporter (DMT)-like permease